MILKVIFIVGPTATGKTNLALDLASKYNGDLISADSVQVFKKLDIVSGKDLPPNYKFENGYYSRISSPSIYLLDVVEPSRPFSVTQFYNLAIDCINKIVSNSKMPFVVGGTGLYIESLLNGLRNTAEPDKKLRLELDKLSIPKLQDLVPRNELFHLNESDINNKRRLIRIIERSKNIEKSTPVKKREFNSLVLGLECGRDILRERIDKRVTSRLESGALDEVKKLFEDYEVLTQQVKDANGYKQLFKFLKEELSFDEAIYRWKISEYHHAKNQMTWFRKYGNVEWFDIEKSDFKEVIKKRIEEFLEV